jgi:hypothetical protein
MRRPAPLLGQRRPKSSGVQCAPPESSPNRIWITARFAQMSHHANSDHRGAQSAIKSSTSYPRTHSNSSARTTLISPSRLARRAAGEFSSNERGGTGSSPPVQTTRPSDAEGRKPQHLVLPCVEGNVVQMGDLAETDGLSCVRRLQTEFPIHTP